MRRSAVLPATRNTTTSTTQTQTHHHPRSSRGRAGSPTTTTATAPFFFRNLIAFAYIWFFFSIGTSSNHGVSVVAVNAASTGPAFTSLLLPMRAGHVGSSLVLLRRRPASPSISRHQQRQQQQHHYFSSFPWFLGRTIPAPSTYSAASSSTFGAPPTSFVAGHRRQRRRPTPSWTSRRHGSSTGMKGEAAGSFRSSPTVLSMETMKSNGDINDDHVDWGDASSLTLIQLQERVHGFIDKWRRHHQDSESSSPALAAAPPRLAVTVAGGGGHFLSTLSSTPGASSVLLQGTLLYDRESAHAYLDQFPPTSSSLWPPRTGAPATVTASGLSTTGGSFDSSSEAVNGLSSTHSDATTASTWGRWNSTVSGNSNNSSATIVKFQYASLSAARQLSMAALHQACRLSAAGVGTAEHRYSRRTHNNNSNVDGQKHFHLERRNLLHRHLTSAVGVGSSSALQTNTSAAVNVTSSDKPSQAHVVVHRPDGRTVHELSMTLRHVGDSQQGANADADDDERHGRQVRFLQDVAVAHGVLSCIERATRPSSSDSASLHSIMVQEGGDVQVEFRAYEADGSAVPATEDDELRDDMSAVVHEAVHRVLSHPHSVVALVPEYRSHGVADATSVSISFSLLSHFALPPTSMVFPGSFNPVHEGHVQLARAAMDAVPQLRNVVWFELSLTNADKPALSSQEVEKRVRYFASRFAGELSPLVDFQWGILLSDAPLFKQKVDLLHPLLVPASAARAARCLDDDVDGLDIIIGTDTLVRLIDPKYYDGSFTNMVKALESMPARFVVGGRAVQVAAGSGDANSTVSTSFRVGHDDVERLPEELQSRFVLLPEETFRVDVSSTEIRRKMQEEEVTQESAASSEAR